MSYLYISNLLSFPPLLPPLPQIDKNYLIVCYIMCTSTQKNWWCCINYYNVTFRGSKSTAHSSLDYLVFPLQTIQYWQTLFSFHTSAYQMQHFYCCTGFIFLVTSHLSWPVSESIVHTDTFHLHRFPDWLTFNLPPCNISAHSHLWSWQRNSLPPDQLKPCL